MDSARNARVAWLASALCALLLASAGPLQAASFLEFPDPHPAPGNQFGATVVTLSTGNVVITSPNDDVGGADAGAVYLFNGATGALISAFRGATAGDRVGLAVTALPNGNYVVTSQLWDNGAVANAGAVTWCNGFTGLSGVISPANSLVGSTANDFVGSNGVTVLSNGNFVVSSPSWHNGTVINAGAATWGSATAGVAGVVSAGNSLVGSTANDFVGNQVRAIANGRYVVGSPFWDNGATTDAGAATWANATSGVSGAVSSANSLVGASASDMVPTSITALTNGNYVVSVTSWHNGGSAYAGAATWCNGATGLAGMITSANSLVGSSANDQVGQAVTALTNGNYVVSSPAWSNGGIVNVGAVTWANGTSGVTGAVSLANSLVGATAGDFVGSYGAKALTNGHYVVASPSWDNGAVADAGAVTRGSGTSGLVGVVSAANSLVGSSAGDGVGVMVVPLTNGNYVVASTNWNNGAITLAGAVTWCSGAGGPTGPVSAANSLVGTTLYDHVGNVGVTALSNGNYVVGSQSWDNGAVPDAGAATWGSGTAGVSGALSAANSLVGTSANDNVGRSVTALSNGNYVVGNSYWRNGSVPNAGAATWGNGAIGRAGAVSTANSLVGSSPNDNVGDVITALTNGNYVVTSPYWDTGSGADAGAATWGNGASGTTGVVSSANSLVGSTASDLIGTAVKPLSNGNYVVYSPYWHNGALASAGAASWGNGTSGAAGVVTAANGMVGTTANADLGVPVEDIVNGTFIGAFISEGGGRVRVGPEQPPVIVGLADIPNDQGGWLRITFTHLLADAVGGAGTVTMYGVWRRVPGTLANAGEQPVAGVKHGSAVDAAAREQLRATLPGGLDARTSGERLYVVAADSRQPVGIAGSFPPGTWELVASIPALQQAQYLAAVPTVSNAAPNEYVVTGHTTTPSAWFASAPASGQSVDNLAPATPASLTAAYAGGQTQLQWAPNTENDLASYRVYRGTSAAFTPDAGSRIASPAASGYADAGSAGRYYKVSAVDVNGNESGWALITPGATTAVEDGGPVAFALEGVRPNPARGDGLRVTFALPAAAGARLELLDVSGRSVVARDVGALGVGRHTVDLAAGHRVAPGVYWVRLTQGANRQTARVGGGRVS